MSEDQTHKAEMRKLQAEQKRKTDDARDPDRGLVLVHTGDGKGKSSSAFGVIVRAPGWGKSVGVVQFIKGKWVTGERQFFDKLGTVDWHTMGDGFTWDTQDRQRDIAAARAAWDYAKELMADPSYRMVILDELNIVLRYDYIPLDEVLEALRNKPEDLHVVVTGRNAKDPLIEIADLVTEMTQVKHPFRSGVKAQLGIEF